MTTLFKQLFRLDDTAPGVTVSVRSDILEDLNLKLFAHHCKVVPKESIPESVNIAHSPFSVTIKTSASDKVTTTHDDFVAAIKQGEKTFKGMRAYIRNRDGAPIAEIVSPAD
jgi:hypothetical protein